jgi:hypothetical protein
MFLTKNNLVSSIREREHENITSTLYNVFCPFYLWRGPESRSHVTKAALQMLFTLLGYNGQLIVCDFIKMIFINLYFNSLDDNCF